MRIVKISIVLLLFCALVSGCKKDKVQAMESLVCGDCDTIKPYDFFPIFPGSYWKYIDTENELSQENIAPNYIIDSGSNSQFSSSKYYVPVYKNYAYWGYERHNHNAKIGQEEHFVKLVSEVDTTWKVVTSLFGINRTSEKLSTTLTVSGISFSNVNSVTDRYTYGPPVQAIISRSFYAKNVGLIRKDFYDKDYSDSVDNVINSKLLVDFYINK